MVKTTSRYKHQREYGVGIVSKILLPNDFHTYRVDFKTGNRPYYDDIDLEFAEPQTWKSRMKR